MVVVSIYVFRLETPENVDVTLAWIYKRTEHRVPVVCLCLWIYIAITRNEIYMHYQGYIKQVLRTLK